RAVLGRVLRKMDARLTISRIEKPQQVGRRLKAKSSAHSTPRSTVSRALPVFATLAVELHAFGGTATKAQVFTSLGHSPSARVCAGCNGQCAQQCSMLAPARETPRGRRGRGRRGSRRA